MDNSNKHVDYDYTQYSPSKNLGEGQVIGGYEVIRYISSGNYGKVFKAKKADKYYAMKLIDMKKLQGQCSPPKLKKLKEMNKRQCENSLLITSQHVCKFQQMFHNHDQSLLFIVMNYCEGITLRKYIDNLKNQVLLVSEALHLFYQIASGIKDMHHRNIMHRDLHFKNIIVDGQKAYVIDLGFSKIVRDAEVYEEHTYFQPNCTTAPEILGKQKYSLSVDIWSLGVILYYLLTKKFIFDKDILEMKNYSLMRQKMAQIITTECQKLLEKLEVGKSLLKINPLHRPTIEQVLRNNVFRQHNIFSDPTNQGQSSISQGTLGQS